MKASLCSALVSLVSAALLVHAVPAPQVSTTHLYGRSVSDSDAMIFRFADLLEQLEGAFYTQALEKFKPSDFDAVFREDPATLLRIIREQEAAHSAFLQRTVRAAGQVPLACNFKFDSVLKDVHSVLGLARAAEQIGTSTFSGAAHLLADPSLLTRTVTIMSDEARHSSTLNRVSGTGFPFPTSFDVALNANEALALVGPLIDGTCDSGVEANRILTITNPDPVKAGTLVTFSSGAFNGSTAKLFCQIITGESTEAISMPLNNCIIPGPESVKGPAYIWATEYPEPLPNDVVARAMSQVVAGPVLVFIDN